LSPAPAAPRQHHRSRQFVERLNLRLYQQQRGPEIVLYNGDLTAGSTLNDQQITNDLLTKGKLVTD
jgi:tRNA A37 threonylcarbamoyladenosine biosynthesis protein TsaE